VLARLDGPLLDPAWEVSEVGLEDIILAYMSQDEALTAGPLSMAGGTA
jgi:ABC-2 type transport system ATP-binding protein